ncbi:helix-turn-helix transcriptional regulator [Nonomuraea lactucae]|uniref:helix-turn-helix transcriptional regulator n=1 Tax=Nonomuraea lactucae TaxID=2249762 RepID=UPI000DE35841|nr:helix-turn-helix transcriptional regulator [Nonomuraea lactucae]
MTSHDNEFGRLLRAWRDRAQPGELGLPASGARRVPGLRREELAAFADLSVDYIMRLEQGRADNPSPNVVAALGRALLLSKAELDHFYRLAGHLPPSELVVPSYIAPGVQRLLTRLADTPIAVYDAAWTLLSHNPLWRELFGQNPVGRAGNVAWTTFTHAGPPVVASPEEFERFQRALVADLRRSLGRYPHDRFVRQLVGDLLEDNPVFAAMWADGVVVPFASERKTIDHPGVGRLILDCDVLTSVEGDLRIVAYTAPLGSETADKLRSLALDVNSTPAGRVT